MLFIISAIICGLVYVHQKLTFLGYIPDTDQQYYSAKGWFYIAFFLFIVGAIIVLV